jgi:uncharacterized protein (DUF58 family)
LQGNWRSSQRGQGMLFDTVREYSPGDDVRHIDWKVTARTGRPHLKLFHEERQQQVMVLVDDSPSMQFGTRGTFKNVQAARLTAMIGGSAMAQHERLGGGVFSVAGKASSLRWIAPQSHRRAALQLLRPLTVPPAQQESAPSTLPALLQALVRLGPLRSIRSRLCILSDFSMVPAQATPLLRQALAELRRRHRVTLLAIDDAADKAMPQAGWLELQGTGASVQLDSGNTRLRETYAAYWEQRRGVLRAEARSLGIELLECSTADGTRQLRQLLRG